VRRLLAFALALIFLGVVGQASAVAAPPWRLAALARSAFDEAEVDVVLGSRAEAHARLAAAAEAARPLAAGHARSTGVLRSALDQADGAVDAKDEAALAAAKARFWTALLGVAALRAETAARAGDVRSARAWLLVREFRPPTRFSRPSTNATRALDSLARGAVGPAAAAAAVRNDLLETYDGRLRSSLGSIAEATRAGLRERVAELGELSLGYWQILRSVYVRQRGAEAAAGMDQTFERLARATAHGPGGTATAAARQAETQLDGFRAFPLDAEELRRRAGQVERFLKLVPIEYGRGVSDGRVTLSFEVQEAITFHAGAASALRDLAPVLLRRDRARAVRVQRFVDTLGGRLAAASRQASVSDPAEIAALSSSALELLSGLYLPEWKNAAKTADFDVIAATLDRLQAAVAAGEWGRAESARLEAYGVFELGPEQRLRGLASSVFQEIEGYFWYGSNGHDGLVQLIKRKADSQEIAATRRALNASLADAERRIGQGGSSFSVVTNSAIIVFREGLEAVLILAALMASMIGPQRRYRRPLLLGVGGALVASVATWTVAQTVLGSLARYGERLEAIVSLAAIGVLLLILNWFYHRVYWQQNLQDLHRKKRRALSRVGVSILAAQTLALAALGFTSVYREGFETVLFLQALTLEAGPWSVLQGAAMGFAGVLAVFFLVVGLERKLPHKKLLIATGIMITWVLVVMVGTTVQTLQKVGWLAVSPIDGLDLPYWAGLWFGVYPTWQGISAQALAAAFVFGSYGAAEHLRARRRARLTLATETPAR
jgi:high-affinity iron transporter